MTAMPNPGCQPLYATPRTPGRQTLGPRVTQVSELLGKPFMPWQRHVMDVALEIDDDGLPAYHTVILVVMRQNGKAIDSNEYVLTAAGWRRMGDLVPGDYVFHPDGHPIEVTHAFAEMTGHVCYRVTTTDGRSVVADADHLWTVRDNGNQPQRPWRTLTTQQILDKGVIRSAKKDRRSISYRYTLPVQRAVKTPDADLMVDPYLLGAWLGDGSSGGATFTSHRDDVGYWSDVIRSAGFAPTVHRIAPHKTPTLGITGGFLIGLRALGVLNNKHVPDEYLTAGHDQRLALLQGLMDTDGSISKAGQAEFYSMLRPLADAALFLARSLGWRAVLREKRAMLNGVDHGTCYRVAFTPSTDDPCPFRIPRKAVKVREPRSRGGERHAVSIMSIEPVPSVPVRCIKVDSPDGLFLAGRDLVATHNTEIMLPLMTHRATGWGPNQRILYTTQTAAKAREKWEDLHVKRLKESPLGPMFQTRLRLNSEAMIWQNGSMWSPGAATAKTGGTGDTLNLGIIDEAWSRPDNRTEVGMRPAMLTQPNRQLWLCSMVPGASRAAGNESMYLRQKMRTGRALVEQGKTSGIAYFEFAAEAGMDPGDPGTWWSCMPALGHTITEKNIQADYDSMELVDFCAEYLGWWPQENRPTWQFIKEPTWEVLRDQNSQLTSAISIGVDIDPERRHAAIAVAGLREDGDWHVEVVEPGGRIASSIADLDWLLPRLMQLVESHEPLAVVLDPKSPARSLLTPLAAAGVTVEAPNGLEVAAACSRFFDATGQVGYDPENPAPRRLRHLGQRSLNAAVSTARKLTSPTNGTFVYSRVSGGSNLSPLYAVTLAMHGYEVHAPEDYDLLESVY